MTRANDLVVIFLGLELLSLSLYVLVGFLRHDVLSNEGGIKYLLLGAFSTGFFLFGAALAYGATGTRISKELLQQSPRTMFFQVQYWILG